MSIAAQILTLIRSEHWLAGTHMAAQGLADRLRVSRQPIAEALKVLEEEGALRRERNRGYFLACDASALPAELVSEASANDASVEEGSYFRIAEDAAAVVSLDARARALPRALRSAPAHPRPAGAGSQRRRLGRDARTPH